MSDEKPQLPPEADFEPDLLPSAEDALPPVRAPSATFILQLFLIPMIIVTIILVVCLLFNWLAHVGKDPVDLVNDLDRLNEGSWQKAYTLSNLLRDPKHSHLKSDVDLAQKLTDILHEQLEEGSTDAARLRLRIFLCRALGEFHIPIPVDVLIEVAKTERNSDEISVRFAAIEALAVLSKSLSESGMPSRGKLVDTLVEISKERSSNPDLINKKGELRAVAAYALGVLGGSKADDRLAEILDDAHPNARYNAATGLARRGDARCEDVIVEMLDPDEDQFIQGESPSLSASEKERKRHIVVMNGLRATGMLAESTAKVDLDLLVEKVTAIENGNLPRPLRIKATEVRLLLNKNE